ncbi:tellurite resistance protein [Hyphomicrobium methylovorum]|uniref:DUF1971 domain-containing protein n=1 Tax=Hyphomicrobium methylovorum TaxID=84 RepID=UPI0015E739BE|nr:DUF1971 domain-containing protein [Hyphomicrobium methylovorum]MBA2125513.1 tellurite resistance protein [Hyphomicrobium methylovorum]
MAVLPENVSLYRTTAVFTAQTVPAGLLANHTTKAGVWAQLKVVKGTVQYFVEGAEQVELRPGSPGIIEPQQVHHIRPSEDAEFFIEFFR